MENKRSELSFPRLRCSTHLLVSVFVCLLFLLFAIILIIIVVLFSPLYFPGKRVVVVTARVHPGEVSSSHVLHGALTFITNTRMLMNEWIMHACMSDRMRFIVARSTHPSQHSSFFSCAFSFLQLILVLLPCASSSFSSLCPC